jgi:hypothetical protein
VPFHDDGVDHQEVKTSPPPYSRGDDSVGADCEKHYSIITNSGRRAAHGLLESDSAGHENVVGRTKSNVRVVFDDRELLDGKQNQCGLCSRINWWCQRGVIFAYSAAAS